MHCIGKILSEIRQRVAKKVVLGLGFLLIVFSVNAQELFPLNEPASTLPKGALGVRLFSQNFKGLRQWRDMTYLRLMYGVTPKLSVYLSAIAANYHGLTLPVEFPFHNTPELGKIYPYKFKGFWAYGKYRFLSDDGYRSHFRLSAFAEISRVKSTHHVAEPNLEIGDNSGLGFGLIATVLENKFAVSLTSGAIFPFLNHGLAPDPVGTLPDISESVLYGKAFMYQLSFGYRLLPLHYHDFKQGNLNIYAEFGGKMYSAAKVNIFAGSPNEYYLQNAQYPLALQGSSYVDFSPGIQYIYRSNLRIDFSITFRWLGFSYAYDFYPVYSIGIQRYFYFKNSK